jgi:hypothetical protein
VLPLISKACSSAGPESVYQQTLDKYFDGEQGYRTLEILDRLPYAHR